MPLIAHKLGRRCLMLTTGCYRPEADVAPSGKQTLFTAVGERLATGYCGEQKVTPIPNPSGVQPAAIICARTFRSVVKRWFGAPPIPLLYIR